MVGTTIGAQNGVLFKGGDILERAKDVDTVVFDKTGTLTKGEMELTDVVVFDGDGQPITDGGQLTGRDRLSENDVLRLAATAESGSEHPLARAIVDGARDRGIDVSDPDDFENVPGHGIRATVGDSEVLVGNRKFLRDNGIDPSPAQETMERLENEGKTAMLVARVPAGTDEGELVGVVADADTVKESAKDAVSQLQERGVDVMMITGDNERTARAVAEQVGIDPENVHAEVLPEDKSDAVEAIQDEGRKAMMVGDGVNDAPALAVAYVGTAIGSGDGRRHRSGGRDADARRPAGRGEGHPHLGRDTPEDQAEPRVGAWLQHGDDPVGFTRAASARPAAGAMAFSSVSVLSNSLLFRRYTRITITSSSAASGELPHPTRSRLTPFAP